MKFRYETKFKIVLGLVLTTLTVGLFTLCFSLQAGVGGMAMNDCPTAGSMTTMCPHQFSNHVSWWRGLWQVTVPNDVGLGLLFLLTIGLLAVVVYQQPNKSGQYTAGRARARDPNVRLHNFLVTQFARGILQPKLYA